MAEISAKDVAALRKITGAGMMDCKKALLENDGDIERAKDWLREKGIAGRRQARRPRRRPGRDRGARRRQRRRARRAQLRDRLRRQGRRVQAGRRARWRGSSSSTASTTSARQQINGETVDDFVKGLSGTLGEKIELGRVVRFETDRRPARRLQAHPERARRRSACSSSSAASTRPTRRRARSRTTSRCTSRAPRRATSPATRCRPTTVEREREIYESQTREEGKPEQAWPKIVEGKLNGFYKATAARWSSSRSSRTRSRRSARWSPALGGDADVRRFARVKIGEE